MGQSVKSEACAWRVLGMWWPAVLFLLLTAGISLAWSHARMLDNDEFLVLWTDHVPTLTQVVHVQLHSPISLDPMVYQSLAHFALTIFHSDAFAIRLPSLLGYLLMQVCLYQFVRRFASAGAAVFALAFPALPAMMFYSAEGRPYGLLLGLFALVMLSWQSAVRSGDVGTKRTGALVTLAVSLALALNTHYYAVLLLVPIVAADCWRAWCRRGGIGLRVDWPLLAAVMAGTAGMVCTLPFAKAAAVFRKHYYFSHRVSLHAVTQSYRAMLLDYTQYSLRAQHVLAMLFVLLTAAFLWASVGQLQKRVVAIEGPEIVFLVTLAALPFFGFLMARYVTHVFEVRYVCGAMVGIVPLVAIALTPVFKSARWTGVLLGILFAAIAVVGISRIETEKKITQMRMASLELTPAEKAAVMSSPAQKLYVQFLGKYAVAAYYEPDPEVRKRLVLVYSEKDEIEYQRRDTISLTAEHMQHFTDAATIPFEELAKQPGGLVFVQFQSGWDWSAAAFAKAHASVRPIAGMLDGQVVVVRFPQ